jgi:hypothetical protein
VLIVLVVAAAAAAAAAAAVVVVVVGDVGVGVGVAADVADEQGETSHSSSVDVEGECWGFGLLYTTASCKLGIFRRSAPDYVGLGQKLVHILPIGSRREAAEQNSTGVQYSTVLYSTVFQPRAR